MLPQIYHNACEFYTGEWLTYQESHKLVFSKQNRAVQVWSPSGMTIPAQTITAHNTCTVSSQRRVPSWRGKWHKVPSVTENLLANDGSWEKESPCSLRVVLSFKLSHLKDLLPKYGK